MNDIITDNLSDLILVIQKNMADDSDNIDKLYANKFYLNLQKVTQNTRSSLSFANLDDIWNIMVKPLLVQENNLLRLEQLAHESTLDRYNAKHDTSELHSTIKELRQKNQQLWKHSIHREKAWKNILLKYAEHYGDSRETDYESVRFDDSDDNEFCIFYQGGQISMNEIVLRLNRLSALEKQIDDISGLVLLWTEQIADYTIASQDYDRGYIRGVESCRDSISGVWHE